ncbi:67ace922-8685-41e3-bda2-0885fba413c4 [Thermothielavioides terrestris]|uniref:catechol O-methyltransferase n=1 Tax=Thermothielavioides terrestris TaxID=2587410 RepID=A0A446B7D9_9PEZI|nr:67ace922-8685-41e3-bda2-0885fba413c4 [Thermothielavioides terrestris]
MTGERRSEYTRTEGSEVKLLHFIYSRPDLDEIRGNPGKVLDLIEEFEKQYWFPNVGRTKGEIVVKLIEEHRPRKMIELGGYVGYSAILFGDALRRHGGERYYSLELNPEFAAVANMLIELAGLRDFVQTIVGRSDKSLHKLYTSGEISKIELLFIDHYKPAYKTDLQLCEELELIQPGSVIAADNVLFPGNPPYLQYVRSTVAEKRQAAQKASGFSKDGFSEKTLSKYMGQDSAPAFEVVGNPNIVYESTPIQPEGDPDAIEVTKCVAVEEES